MSMSTHIFLCHAREDKQEVQKVYQILKQQGFDPWLDTENLLPGQLWDDEIRNVIRRAAIVIVFLSNASVRKRGYVQKEFRIALDVLQEVPEGQIFVIPVKLDDCKVPEMFSRLHWTKLYEPYGIEKILSAIRRQLTPYTDRIMEPVTHATSVRHDQGKLSTAPHSDATHPPERILVDGQSRPTIHGKVQCVRCGTLLSTRATECPRCGNTDPFGKVTGICVECLQEIPPHIDPCPICGEPSPLRVKSHKQGLRIWLLANSRRILPPQRMSMYLLNILGDESELVDYLEFLRQLIVRRHGIPVMPEAGQTAAISIDSPKIAALAYDRVWASTVDMPDSIRFFGGSKVETVSLASSAVSALEHVGGDMPDKVKRVLAQASEKIMEAALEVLDDAERLFGSADSTIRWHSELMNRELRIHVVPVYTSTIARDADYPKGKDKVIAATISNIPVVDVEQLDWKQIVAFREDRESVANYRCLAHRVDQALFTGPPTRMEELLGQRLFAYQLAIQKHGLPTKAGVLSSTVLLHRGLSSAPESTDREKQPKWLGSIKPDLFAFGPTKIELSTVELSITDLQIGQYNEVSFVHELRALPHSAVA